MLRAALLTIVLNAGAIALAFFNQLLIAAAFGASSRLDSYFVGVSVPSAIAANASQMLVYAVMPLLLATDERGSDTSLAGAFLIVFGGIALLLAVLGAAFGLPLVRLLAGGGADLGVAHGSFVTFCGVGFFLVVVGMLTAQANASRSFLWPIAAGYAVPIGSAASILLLRSRFGVEAIAVGSLAGSAVAAAVLGGASWRRFALPPYPAETWRAARRTLAATPYYLLGLLPFSALTVSDSFWGARLGESVVSSLGYANRVLVTLAGVLMMGPVAVLGQRLSEQYAQGDFEASRATFLRGVRTLLWMGGYAGVLLFVLAEPLVRTVLQRGAFGPDDTTRVAALLRVMSLGLIGANCAVLSFRAFFGTRRPRLAAAFGVGLATLYAGLSGLLGARLGAIGIAWAYTISWWLVSLASVSVLAGGAARVRPVEAVRVAATLLAVAVLASATYDLASGAVGGLAFPVLAAGAVSLFVFGLLAVVVFRVPEVTSLCERLRLIPGGRRT